MEWDLFDCVVFYHSAMRNQARERIIRISDRVASGDISAEIRHYDKHGKEIRGEGRSDPVGFKEHMRKLYMMIGLEQPGPRTEKKNLREDAANKALSFFSGFMGMKGGG